MDHYGYWKTFAMENGPSMDLTKLLFVRPWKSSMFSGNLDFQGRTHARIKYPT